MNHLTWFRTWVIEEDLTWVLWVIFYVAICNGSIGVAFFTVLLIAFIED